MKFHHGIDYCSWWQRDYCQEKEWWEEVGKHKHSLSIMPVQYFAVWYLVWWWANIKMQAELKRLRSCSVSFNILLPEWEFVYENEKIYWNHWSYSFPQQKQFLKKGKKKNRSNDIVELYFTFHSSMKDGKPPTDKQIKKS